MGLVGLDGLILMGFLMDMNDDIHGILWETVGISMGYS